MSLLLDRAGRTPTVQGRDAELLQAAEVVERVEDRVRVAAGPRRRAHAVDDERVRDVGIAHLCDLALADRLAPFLALVGIASLFAYAVVQTLPPEDRSRRLFADYAGVFLVGALLWGWGVDGKQPDCFDCIGAVIALTGVAVVLWGRDIFA